MSLNIGRYELAINPTQVDLNSTSSALVITPAIPIQVVRWGLIVSVAITGGGTSLVLHGNHEEADGTAVDPTGADAMGTITGQAAAIGANTCYYQDLSNPYLILPGERAEFIVGAGATDGDGFIWAQYLKLPFQAQPTNRASTDPGYTTPGFANWLSGYTEVTS